MPVIKVKNGSGIWQDIATANSHEHTMSDITDLPASLVDDVEALKDKVGAHSVAYQVSTAVEANNYTHPETHPANMITGLADIAITGSYNDLKDLPEAPDIETYATKVYVQEEIAKIDVTDDLVQSDWNQTDDTQLDYIKNKPVIPSIDGLATKTYVDEQIASIDVSGDNFEQVQSDWDETDTTSPAYIKNKPSISGEGGASVQANWGQIDSTQADYIKNKPFGEYKGTVDVLPITTYDNFYLSSAYGTYVYFTAPTYELTLGEVYTVLWDGTEYECAAQDASALASGAVLIGNASAFGFSGNNEPFIIACLAGQGVQYFALTDTQEGNSHSVRITKVGIGIKKIEAKYLEQPNWDETDKTSVSFIQNKPFGETPSGTVIIEETTVDCATLFTDDLYYSTIPNLDIGVYLYNVVFNGTTYEVMGEADSIFGVRIEYQDDNVDFIIVKDFNGTNISMLLSTQGEHTFSVTLAEDAVKKIDAKYIPKVDGLPEITADDNNKTLVVSNGAWTVAEPAKGVPEVTTDDNGKFLRVVDGVWAAATVLNAEEVSF